MIYTTRGIKTIEDYVGNVVIKNKMFCYFADTKNKVMWARNEETGEIIEIKKNGYICSVSTIKKAIMEVFKDEIN